MTNGFYDIDDPGWCSSCDAVWHACVYDEDTRPFCPDCGDVLIFADEENEVQSDAD